VVEKVEYWTQQGRQTLYIVVSFLPVADGRERAIEFFMPVGQSGESQQWITSSMRHAVAGRARRLPGTRAGRHAQGRLGPRAGAPGHLHPADGTAVPLWHDSEVAAIAYAIQNIIARRRASPSATLATPAPTAPRRRPHGDGRRQVPECGAHAMIRKDGCDFCTQCGHVGACG
jgi:ribonucleoside-diphosphate reductase alpha chain